jgi:hypothetical protein
VFAFSGTSVTAGHDNYFNASYPIVFGEIVKPAFKAAGVELESRNFAMGNNPVIPYDLCVQTLAGSDVDIVSWEQSMMCARSAPNCMEIFTRNALRIPSMPSVLIVDAVPDFDDGYRAELDKPAQYWIHPEEREDLLKKYKNWGIHYYSAGVAAKNRNLKPQLGKMRMVQDGKPFKVKKNWHPGPYGHLLNAQVLSYQYLQILKEALADLKSKLELPFADQMTLLLWIKENVNSAQYKDQNLPEAHWTVENYEIDLPGAQCATIFEPRYSQNPDLSTYLTKDSKYIDLRPNAENYDGKDWAITLWPFDVQPVQTVIRENRGLLDRKFCFSGNNLSGAILFQIPISRANSRLYICTPPPSWGTKVPAGYIDMLKHPESVQVYLDSKLTTLKPPSDFGACGEISIDQISIGNHTIKLIPLLSERIAISHLVWH